MKRLAVKLYNDSDIVYRGKQDSGKIKEILAGLKDSVLRAYLRGQRTARELEQVTKAVYYQNITVNNSLLAAHFDMNVQNEVGSDKVVWRNFYAGTPSIIGTAPIDGPSSNITIEGEFGQAVLSQPLKTSKITTFVDNVGVTYVGTSVKVYMGDALASPIQTTEVTDRDDFVYSILDGDSKTFWIDDTSNLDAIALDIVLPSSISTKANVITINPFPFQSTSIIGAQYKTLTGNNWVDIPLGAQEILSGLERAPMRLHYNAADYGDEIRLLLGTTSIGEKKIAGLSDVNIEYVEYESTGYMYDDLVIPEADDGGTIYQITSFEPYYTIDMPVNETVDQTQVPIKFQLMNTDGTVIYDSQTDGAFTTDSTPKSGLSGQTTMRIKTEMNSIGNVTPVLKGYRVTYTTS